MEMDITQELCKSPDVLRCSSTPFLTPSLSFDAASSKWTIYDKYITQWANCLKIAPPLISAQHILEGDFIVELFNLLCGSSLTSTSISIQELILKLKSECLDAYFLNRDLIDVSKLFRKNTDEIIKFSILVMYISFMKTNEPRLIGPPQSLELETQEVLQKLAQGILGQDKHISKEELNSVLSNTNGVSYPRRALKALNFSRDESMVYTNIPSSPLCSFLKDSRSLPGHLEMENSKIKILEGKLQERVVENEYLQDEVKEFQEKLKTLEIKLAKEKQNNMELRRLKDELQSEIFELHQNGSNPEHAEKFQQQIMSLQSRVSELEEDNESISNAQLDLQRNFEIMKSQHEQCHKYKQQVQTYEEMVDGYRSDLTRLKLENQSLHETNKELLDHLEKLRASSKKCLDESNDAVLIAETLKESCVDKQFEEMRSEYNKLTSEWTNLANMLEVVEVPIAAEDFPNRDSMCQKIKHLVETNSGLQFSLDSLVRVLEQKQSEIDIHISHIKTLEVRVEETTQSVQDCKQSLSNYESEKRLLNDELTSCQALTENLRNLCDKLQTELNIVTEESAMSNCNWKNLEAEYQTKITALENEIKNNLRLQSDLAEKVQQLEDINNKKVTEVENLQRNLINQEEECKRLKVEAEGDRCAREILEQQLFQVQASFGDAKKEVETKIHQCERLQNDVNTFQDKFNELAKLMSQKEDELANFKARSIDSEREHDRLLSTIGEKEVLIVEKTQQVAALTEKQERLEERVKQMEDLCVEKDTESKTLQQNLLEGEEKCNILRVEIEESHNVRQTLELNLLTLKSNVCDVQREVDLKTELCKRLEDDLNSARDTNNNLTKLIAERDEEIVKFKARSIDLEGESSRLSSTIEEKEAIIVDKNKEMAQLIEVQGKCEEQLRQMERVNNELNSKARGLEERLSEREEKCNGLELEVEEARNVCQMLEQEVSIMKSALVDSEKGLGLNTELCEQLQNNLVSSRNENIKLSQLVSLKDNEIDDLKTKTVALEEEIAKLLESVEENGTAIAENSLRTAQLIEVQKGFEEKTKQLEDLNMKLDLESQSVQQKLVEYEEKCVSLESEVTNHRNAYQMLEQELMMRQSKYDEDIKEAELKNQLCERLQNELKSFRSANGHLGEVIARKDSDVIELKSKVSALEHETSKLTSTIVEKEGIIRDKNNEMSQLTALQCTLVEKVQGLEETINTMLENTQSDLDNQATIRVNLEEELREKGVALEEKENILLTQREEINKLLDERKCLEDDLRRASDDLALKSPRDSEQMAAEFEQAKQTLASCLSQMDEQSNRHDAMVTEMQQNVNEKVAELQEKEALIATLREERDSIRADLDFKKKQYNELQREYNEKCQELTTLGSNWDVQLRNMSDSKTNLINSYEARLKSLVDGFGVRLDDMNTEKQELEMRLENTDNEKNNLSRQLTQKDVMYRALEDQLASLVVEKSNVEFQNETLTQRNKELSLLVTTLDKEISLANKKAKESTLLVTEQEKVLNDRVKLLENSVVELEKQLLETENATSRSLEIFKNKETDIQELLNLTWDTDSGSELVDFKGVPIDVMISTILEHYVKLNNIFCEEKNKLASVTEEKLAKEEMFNSQKLHLEAEVSRVTNENHKLMKELDSLKDAQEEQSRELSSKEDLETEAKASMTERITSLRTENLNLKNQNERLCGKVNDLQSELKQVEKNVKDKVQEKMKTTYQTEIQKLLESINILEKEYSEKSTKYKADNKMLKEKYELAKKKLAEMHEEVTRNKASNEMRVMRNSLSSKKEEVAEYKALLEREKKVNLELRRKLNSKEKCTVPYTEKIRELELSLKKETAEKRSLDTQVSLANQKISQLKRQLEKLEPGSIVLDKIDTDSVRSRRSTMNSMGDQLFSSSVRVNGSKKSRSSLSSIERIQFDDDMFKIPAPMTADSSSSDSRRKTMNPPSSMGSFFVCEDEESEIFSSSFLKDLNHGRCDTGNDWTRLSELQRRNTLCLPHLKSSYPAETQFQDPIKFTEDELKIGTEGAHLSPGMQSLSSHMRKLSVLSGEDSSFLSPESPALNTRSRKRKSLRRYDDSSMNSSDSSVSSRKKSNVLQTAYQKPGPPTPGKNQGSANRKSRLSSRTPASIKKLLGRRSILSEVENVNPRNTSSDSLHKLKQGLSFTIGFSPKPGRVIKKKDPVTLTGIQQSSYALRSSENTSPTVSNRRCSRK